MIPVSRITGYALIQVNMSEICDSLRSLAYYEFF